MGEGKPLGWNQIAMHIHLANGLFIRESDFELGYIIFLNIKYKNINIKLIKYKNNPILKKALA